MYMHILMSMYLNICKHMIQMHFFAHHLFFFLRDALVSSKIPLFFQKYVKSIELFFNNKKKKTRCFVVQKNMSLCNDVCKFLGFYCFSWSIPHIKLTEFNYPLHQSSSCFKLVLVLLKWVICQDVNDMSLEVRSELPCCCYQ